MPGFDIRDLAARISDGTAVDWERVKQSTASDVERQLVDNLRVVQRVAWEGEPSEETPLDAQHPPQSWGGLEIRERLGVGAFGEVYRAWDPRLEREVALKLYRRGTSAASRALREGRLLARVDHPNVVRVYGAEEHDGRVGLWMDLVRGQSLDKLLRERGRLGAGEAGLIGVELCRALAAVHRAELVHRDVKAANVMRQEGGRILLMDFGEGIEAARFDEGTISGTPLYMAPEIFAGESATPRSDIYSLGVLLYHVVTGAYPVDAPTAAELHEKLRRREARLLRDERPDLPPAFALAVERALAWEPAERFATAGEMERTLGAALGAETGTAGTGSEPVERARRWARVLSLVLGLGAVLAAAIFLLFVLGRGVGRPNATGASADPAVAAGTQKAAPPVGEPYSASAGVYRLLAGGRERLESGDRLSLGDRVGLEFMASRSLHVYVINEDDQGAAFVLFPLPHLEPQNPLPAGRHLLPGTWNGRAQYWVASSAGGREHLLLLASPEPLVDFEAEMRKLPTPLPGDLSLAIPPAGKLRLRALGELVAGPSVHGPTSPSASRLFEMAEELAAGTQVVQGIWLRRFDLENPGPSRRP